jgi:predicted secreted hydrolase
MRRLFIALRLAILFSPLIVAVPATVAGNSTPALRQADPAYRIRFPEDEGSHPGFGEEWWYVSGWLDWTTS